MDRIHFFFSVLCIGAGFVPALAQDRHPNVIVMLADDQGWGDLGFTGNKTIRTPNIDKIANEGTFLENFYVCPVSSPTRAEFLTGRYHQRSDVSSTSGGGERINLGERTIAEYFQQAGYATSMFGKWHSGTQYPYHPNARGFEEFYGFCSGHWSNYWNPVLEHNGEIVSGEGFIADDLTNKALDYMKKNKDRPFFMYLAYNTPHSPMQVPDSWWNRMKDRPIKQKATVPQQEDSTFTRASLALTENLDWNIGRVLSTLESLDLERETIVVYFSDNGPNSARWNGCMIERKGSTNEGGVRSPFCIRWPGHIKKGNVETQLSGAIDLLPTLLSLADVKYKPYKKLDGLNLKKQLTENNTTVVDRSIFSSWKGKTSVRYSDYLLSANKKLFNLKNDRSQNTDLSKKEPKRYKQLQKLLNTYEKELLTNYSKKDNRPFVVGHPKEVYSKLPARDANISGGIERSAHAPNSSYFTNWRSCDANVTWNVLVEEAGLFEVYIYYTCDARNIGSSFLLSTKKGNENLVFTLDKINDEPMLGADLDRVPRRESYSKGFKPCSVGTISLTRGNSVLSLKATNIKNEEAMNLWMLVLRRIK